VEVLKRLSDAVRCKRGELWRDRSLVLHHDNVPAHSSLRMSQLLAEKGISAVNHPPYSPDLAPDDFWLFPKLKSFLKGKRFSDIEDIKSSAKNFLPTLLFRNLKTALDNCRIPGNIVKNWREIPLKNSRLLISAVLKINKKNSLGIYLPNLYFRISCELE
jgi:transposase